MSEGDLFGVPWHEEYEMRLQVQLLADQLEKPRPSGYSVAGVGVPAMLAEGCGSPIPAAACSQLDHPTPSSYSPLADCVSPLNTPAQRQVRHV